ncbi:3-deoxy-7-phosphoheptulonate synthase [Thermomonospora umbrina]|uniref:Phospho-2-dehydro-3-deoxyheptonate aldolase n=1 Tax=Thermomonospora umbrina TaxID=111806 RepID=A0A3D9SXY5_9ACTN|nr:3-deoxy-7-phosphoheptulonate synthase [Thermomonospora umbrina]REF00820.1 3-deoxy-D-arabinoheptulosonate-7-phosphate synthase [Thermomonospora umbrina]
MTRVSPGTAVQQPEWPDPPQALRARAALASRPALVRSEDLRELRSLLAEVASGHALIVQAGDCAEDPEECGAGAVGRKVALLDMLAGTLGLTTGKPVLRAGRIAGQFAKPRSSPVEHVDGLEVPAYRGHLVNGPEPCPLGRRPDPLRLLIGYMAAADIMEHLGWRDGNPAHGLERPVWTSHEALLLDYERPLLRRDDEGRPFLGSTHWPWIGKRTSQADGAHAALLAEVLNPVACKVGPDTTPAALLALCERLDPGREPGRLTLISRMGADLVADRLPPLVRAVRDAGHPVCWICDPMHGNTVVAPGGRKTRIVGTLRREVVLFRRAVEAAGGVAAGLHLETTPDEVTECATDPSDLARVGDGYTSLCDPRLNPQQALSVVAAWRG